jgi:hypothetical protein
VVTEYRYHDEQNFVIEVDRFSEGELRQQISQLVHAYRHNHFHSSEFRDDRKHWEDQAMLAHNTFKAMFCDRFSDAFLLSNQSEDNIVNTLLDWARELGPAHVNPREVSPSPEACSELLMRLTSEEQAQQHPPAWPYIKKIRLVRTPVLPFETRAH